MKEKVLITGASGFLGSHLSLLAQEKYEVHVLRHQNNSFVDNYRTWDCDLSRYSDMKGILNDLKPSVVYHLAALSDPNTCQLDKQKSRAINFDATVALANLCADQNIEMNFASTDLVFDGSKGNYLLITFQNETDVNDVVKKLHNEKIYVKGPWKNPWSKSIV